MTTTPEQNIRRLSSTHIPIERTDPIARPSGTTAVSKSTWSADESAAASEARIKEREMELNEVLERQRQTDPTVQKVNHLETIVSKQADQIELLMKLLKEKDGK